MCEEVFLDDAFLADSSTFSFKRDDGQTLLNDLVVECRSMSS